MKKTLINLLFLFGISESITAQTISVPDVYASPGQTVALTINLTGGKVNTYTSMAFDVQFPASGFTTTDAYSITALWPDATGVVGNVDGTGLANVSFYSTSELTKGDINYLGTVNFKVDESIEAGDYNVTIKNLVLGYGISDKDTPADYDFKVHVQSGVDVVLDENSPLAPESTISPVNIYVRRTMASGKCNTICLPFDMSYEQVKEAFGDGVKFYEVPEEDVFETDGDKTTVSFVLSDIAGDKFYANWPYIVIPSKDVTDFTVTSQIDIDNPVVEWVKKVNKKNVTYSSFTGTYMAGEVIPEDNLFINDNKFYFSKGKTITKAFRAYLYLKDVVSSSAPILQFIDKETTGISTVKSEKAKNTIYNLNGQRIKNPQKGLFIIDGKKVIIK